MRFQSLVLISMTSLHTLGISSTPPLDSLESLLEKFPTIRQYSGGDSCELLVQDLEEGNSSHQT